MCTCALPQLEPRGQLSIVMHTRALLLQRHPRYFAATAYALKNSRHHADGGGACLKMAESH